MKKRVLMVSLATTLLLTSGCAEQVHQDRGSIVKQISRSYLTDINANDGISNDEALLIAQNHVIFMGLSGDYKLEIPQLEKITSKQWTYRFLPHSKTLGEALHKPDILISIEKGSGRVSSQKDFNKRL